MSQIRCVGSGIQNSLKVNCYSVIQEEIFKQKNVQTWTFLALLYCLDSASKVAERISNHKSVSLMLSYPWKKIMQFWNRMGRLCFQNCLSFWKGARFMSFGNVIYMCVGVCVYCTHICIRVIVMCVREWDRKNTERDR